MTIVQVALPVPFLYPFDYILPVDSHVCIGARVKVPFGARSLYGIVVKISGESDYPLKQLKSISQIIDTRSLFSIDLWEVLLWASRYYHYPLGEVLQQALPVLLRRGKEAAYTPLQGWQLTSEGRQLTLTTLKLSKKAQAILTRLQQQPLYQDQLADLAISRNVLTTLQKKGWVTTIEQQPARQAWYKENGLANGTSFNLNDEQSRAITAITAQLTHFMPWLVEGVTGSGKTEVYLAAIEAVLKQGKQALVLVPEIGLTPQTIDRFRQRFNVPIDVLHSALNDRQRLTVWLRAKYNETAIVIGTRSALFTPFQQLGIVIIDEEHDNSYKQQESWRYHARDMAVMRAQKLQIPIIMGTATPALESLANVEVGKYHLIRLAQRTGKALPVRPYLLDIKGQSLLAGLAPLFLQKMRQQLEAGNQVMIFLNRRGFSPVLLCHECGWIAECPRCIKSYTLHKKHARLRCHHCDSQRPIPHQCGHCGSTQLLTIGVGTEQLESELSQQFVDIPITRIDRDTTSRKGELEHHLAMIHQGGARILIGTQMLAKGHHFSEVTLVGLIDVDGALFSADFRAAERFAQLYTQVAGRAGRENKQGEVILQTHYPEHPLLQMLLFQGYATFSQQALQERRMLSLPPYSFHAILRAEDYNNQEAEKFLQHIAQLLIHHTTQQKSFCLLGPTPALQAKRKGRFRWQLLLQDSRRQSLQQLLHWLDQQLAALSIPRKVKWSLDIDPIES